MRIERFDERLGDRFRPPDGDAIIGLRERKPGYQCDGHLNDGSCAPWELT
jgi:hypothetical protein